MDSNDTSAWPSVHLNLIIKDTLIIDQKHWAEVTFKNHGSKAVGLPKDLAHYRFNGSVFKTESEEYKKNGKSIPLLYFQIEKYDSITNKFHSFTSKKIIDVDFNPDLDKEWLLPNQEIRKKVFWFDVYNTISDFGVYRIKAYFFPDSKLDTYIESKWRTVVAISNT